MTWTTSRTKLPTSIMLRYNSPNTVRITKLNNDSTAPADPTDPNDNPAPVTGAGATVTFTVFSNEWTIPFAEYDNAPMAWVGPLGAEPGQYKGDFPPTTGVPVGQYYGYLTITMVPFGPTKFPLVVTVTR